MDFKLFFSVFGLIFIAELGDKTQLAALAKSADGDKWTVFIAASAALVCSTLLAVMLGGLIKEYVNPIYIKVTAGSLFIIFGCLILWEVCRPAVEKPAEVSMQSGILSSVVFELAADFEEAAATDYAKLAANCEGENLRKLLLELEQEEREHLDKVKHGFSAHGDMPIPDIEREQVPAKAKLVHDVAANDKPIIAHAIEHELATAEFYEMLSKSSVIPAVRSTFAALAVEEHGHAERLREFERRELA